MRIKTFKAPTLKEAMANVKAELGIDAVILHTTRSKKGGLLGFGSKEVVEVIAAVEDEPQQKPVKRASAPKAAAAPAPAPAPAMAPPAPEPVIPPIVPRKAAVSSYQTAGTQFSVDAAQQRAAQYDAVQTTGHNAQGPQIQSTFEDILSSLDRIKAAEGGTGAAAAPADDNQITVGRIIRPMEKKPEPAKEPEFSDAEMAAMAEAAAKEEAFVKAAKQVEDDQETIQSLQNELDEMKEMLARMGKAGASEDEEITLQQALRDCDIDEKIIQDMIRRMSGAEILEDKTSEKAHRTLEKFLKKTVRVASGITLYSDKPKIVALIGPTGVGKTTTLAKIAAKFVLEGGVSAALITADTYRISAVEQLKTYSDILGLPLEIVYSPEALQQAIEKHSDKQLILIDTAGRSQYNEFQMKELIGLFKSNKDIEKHLVLSSTTKNRDAEEILNRFMPCEPDRVIFTKTDETSSLGIVMNLLYKRKIALSYVTNGQSVPDDITPASFTKLADMLLR
ncbi:Flagellar biosynthesis protein FlhF [Anaerovibrio sp. JC8]|uniref:flagellar biosynthesis protein FlhF n=1 Tax=Anaerovibrio sp. JC8 TaxID=1240085 RepID=UPI000A09DE54|nr:flagellar biosynthesis protein FlhF [Anaerovibrio sp. JC8]ORU00386.1 Flagellar biosynthesis protein FlhF [Anaerovibrio sp. JC8]